MRHYTNGAVVNIDDAGDWLLGVGGAFPPATDAKNAPPNGALFWRNDFQAWYAWDRTGSGWVAVDTGGGGVAISAGTASQNTGTVIFSNSNGVSFGLNAGTLTASAAGGGAALQGSGTYTQNTGTIQFANSNGVTFGLTDNQMTATVKTDYLTTAMASNRGSDFVQATAAFAGTSASGTIASNGISVSIGPYLTTAALSNHSHGASAAPGSFAFQTLSFSNANGISFGTSAGPAITASHNALTSQSNQAFSADASSTFQTLTFQNSNLVSFSNNAGAIRVTHDLMASSSRPAFSADASSTFQTLTFQNSNGFTFSNNAGAIRASYTRNVASNAIQSVGSATGSGTNTSRFAPDDHVHAGVFSVGVSNLGNTAGNTRVDVGQFVFQGSNITLSQATAAGALNTVVISAAAPGAAAITQSHGISTATAGGSTAGTTGMVTGDDIQYLLVPGSNITMSQSINGSSGTLSIYGPAAGGGATLSMWNQLNSIFAEDGGIASQVPGNGSILVWPNEFEQAYSFSKFVMSVSLSISTSSNSSHGGTLSVGVGIYTQNVSTLSLATSGLGTYAWTNTSNNSTVSLSGLREASGTFAAMNLTPGNYWIAVWSRTSTVNANWFTASNYIHYTSNSGVVHSGEFQAAAGAANFQPGVPGHGTYSRTSAALPVSMAFADITGTLRAHYRPFIAFRNFNS